jgi:hypothetical protein
MIITAFKLEYLSRYKHLYYINKLLKLSPLEL